METGQTLAQRIKILRTHYHLNLRNFANGCMVSDVTIFKLEKGAKISEKTLLKISSAYGTTREWLIGGIGKMLPGGTDEQAFETLGQEHRTKEYAYKQMLRKNAMLEKEIEKLWLALNQLTEKHNNPRQ
jgi:transcriptional regulator with XRE-family HTH domain